MQNLLLLHLREQGRLTVKKIEKATGITAAQYLQLEQGTLHVSDTEAELLSAFLKIKPAYLKDYSRQLEYFTHCKSLLELKDKRVAELVTLLKYYIERERVPKTKGARENKPGFKKPKLLTK